MKLVVGLGNPGDAYLATRHNIGFMLVDRLVQQRASWLAGHHGLVARLELEGRADPIHVLKPATYMNRSGVSVSSAARAFAAAPEQIVVIHDELDLPFGQLRLKQGGGHAGHNGLKSVAAELGSTDFCRLRLGIGRPSADFSGTVADFVLNGFAAEEQTLLPEVLDSGVQALGFVFQLGLSQAMNRVNRRNPDAAPH